LVYIENQFFITSTTVDGTKIENRIGDALVDRIIRAHKNGTCWKAYIMIPLLPGYDAPIDTGVASSVSRQLICSTISPLTRGSNAQVRLILQCQNRSIARGTDSIFSRLRERGINVRPLLKTSDGLFLTLRLLSLAAQRLHIVLFVTGVGQV
jgi:phospholipase D1/2